MLDTGLARPPSPTYTAITPVTRAPERNEPAAQTEMPAEETVRPSAESESNRKAAENQTNRRSLRDGTAPQVDRRNVIDPESESMVYIATNIDTGEVVRQIPSETLLRLRVYNESLEAQRSQSEKQSVQQTA